MNAKQTYVPGLGNHWVCSKCNEPFYSYAEANACCTIPSAQDAMNRQQEEIKELLISAKEKVYMATHDYDLNDACDAIDRIIQVLAKMNGVEDALK